jgi:hypothetical protein
MEIAITPELLLRDELVHELVVRGTVVSAERRCQIAARNEDFKILSTKLQRAVSLGLNNLM